MNRRIEADDGYWFGMGVFETIWVWRGQAVLLEEHLRRMADAIQELHIISMGDAKTWMEDRKQEIRDYLRGHYVENGALKLTISEKNQILTLRENTYQKDQYRKGFTVCYAQIRRNENSPFTYHKTLNNGDNLLARRLARQAGYEEAIFLNSKGQITEGTLSNIFFVKDEEIITPPISCGLLNGIVRQKIIQTLPVTERVIYPEEADQCQKIFLTNSLMGIMPVCKKIIR